MQPRRGHTGSGKRRLGAQFCQDAASGAAKRNELKSWFAVPPSTRPRSAPWRRPRPP